MAGLKEPKPPKPVNPVCSECGLPWSDHRGDPVTLSTCVKLLKARRWSVGPWKPNTTFQPTTKNK